MNHERFLMHTSIVKTLINQALSNFNNGMVAYSAKRFRDAQAAFCDALDIYQKLTEIDPPNHLLKVAMSSLHLGNAYAKSGMLTEAISRFRDALKFFNQTEVVSPDLANVHMNLANALSQSGELEEAIQHYEGALNAYQGLIDEVGHDYCAQTALTRTNLANTLAEIGSIAEALRQYERAWDAYARLIYDGQLEYRAHAFNVQMNRANVLSDNGQIAEAIEQYQIALAGYTVLVKEGQQEYRRHIALTQMNLATAFLDSHQLPVAIGSYRAALSTYDDLLAEGLKEHLPGAALARMNLANALAEQGQLALAVAEYQHALEIYHQLIELGQVQFRGDEALTRMNLANAMGDNGQLIQSVEQYRFALTIFGDLVSVGQAHHVPNLARVHMNLGTVEAEQRQFWSAIASYSMAQQIYQTLVERGSVQFLPSLARTLMNRGTAYAQEDQLTEATIDFEAALACYEQLQSLGQDHYQPSAVLTRLNYANVLSRQDRFAESLGIYGQVIEAYGSLIAEGRRQFTPELAHTYLNLGNALLRKGDLGTAIAQYQLALEQYGQLVQDGHRQHLAQHIAAADQILQTSLVALMDTDINSSVVDSILSAMRKAFLVLIPLPQISEDSTRLHSLRGVMTTAIKCWQASQEIEHQFPNLKKNVVSLCLGWLDQAAELLAMGRPAYLNDQYAHTILPLLNSVLRIFLEYGQSAPLAIWHLRTQGLRAQRQVIAASAERDPEIAELNKLYARLEALDREIHGRFLAQTDANTPNFVGGISPNCSRTTSQVDGSMLHFGDAKLSRRDRLYFDELVPLEQRLQGLGKLPGVRRVELDAIRLSLRTWQSMGRPSLALLLLIAESLSGQVQMLVAVCIRATAVGSDVTHFRYPLPTGEAELRQLIGGLTDDAASSSRSMRCHVRHIGEGGVLMTDAERDVALTQWLSAPYVLNDALVDLKQQGVSEVHIVPGGDLHVAPWAATLSESVSNLRIRQFPSAASWLRIVSDTNTLNTNSGWACLTCDMPNEQSRALTWAAVEARALTALWSRDFMQHLAPTCPHWGGIEGQQSVNGLIAIGHGDAPNNNWAMSGLVTGLQSIDADGTPNYSYLTSVQLHQIHHARHLILSCCVLGRVRDSQGEPLGMAAQAFNFNTQLAVGAMVPIPDFEGALFSMALHWAWVLANEKALTHCKPMEWSDVFHITRREIMDGHWPLGFGEWLARSLLTMCDGEAQKGQRRQFLDAEAGRAGLALGDKSGLLRQLGATVPPAVRHVASVFTCLG